MPRKEAWMSPDFLKTQSKEWLQAWSDILAKMRATAVIAGDVTSRNAIDTKATAITSELTTRTVIG